MGSGDDSVSIGHVSGSYSGTVDGGEGTDHLTLNDVSKDDWDEGIKDQFTNFESVTLSDGQTYEIDQDASAVTLDMNISEQHEVVGDAVIDSSAKIGIVRIFFKL